jgi:hypothetical protein
MLQNGTRLGPKCLTSIPVMALGLLASALSAAPPLITGDVPTADPGTIEIYLGVRYQDTGSIHRQLPHVELVYGLTERWEISTDLNYLSSNGAHGFDDIAVGTKLMLAPDLATRPGLALSYEFKGDNGDAGQGLGSGGFEHDLRVRVQKSYGSHVLLLNVGRVLVLDATISGVRRSRQDIWRASVADEWALTKSTKALAEIYWRESDEPGGRHRLGWNAGFKHKLRDDFSVHAAVGGSFREGSVGGPHFRGYFGFKYEFTNLPH